MTNDEHIHLNSTTIRARHPQPYEAFFKHCPTVVSAPASLLWSPNYAVGPGGVGIASKLPARLYIGIEPTADSRIEYGPSSLYIPEEDRFVEWNSTRVNPLLIALFERLARAQGIKHGVRIWTLSELPWYRGLNIDSLWAASAAAAWLVHVGTVTPQELESVVTQPSEQLIASPVFDKVFRLAWKIENLIAPGLADAHLIFSSLVKSAFPTIFFRERDPVLFDQYKDFGFEHPSTYYNLSDGLFWRGARMNELFPIVNPRLPLDAALIYLGDEIDSQFVYSSRGAYRETLDASATFAKQALAPITPASFREPPAFISQTGIKSIDTYRETSAVHSLTVLKTVHDLYQYGTAPYAMRAFMDAQNLCQDILRLLGLSTLATDRASTVLREAAGRTTETGVAARHMGAGKQGCVLVFGREHSLEPVIDIAFPSLARDGKTAHCHWASWCDGMNETSGVRVEQAVVAGIRAPGATSVTVREWRSDNERMTYLATADASATLRHEVDVCFDAGEGKVYVSGIALTSETIHSAKQTIELFRKLFLSEKGEVHGADLPESSYRADRNQMDSKIIRPIAGVVKERLGKRLGLALHGGLGSQYTITYTSEPDLRVILIERN